MKTRYQSLLAGLFATGALATSLFAQQIVTMPGRGGGLDTNSPMVHADIFFDAGAKALRVVTDTNYARPKLKPLPEGYNFDLQTKYRVMEGKAYNFQYAWNPGGVFSPPAGAAIWVECLQSTPGLETYDGPGNKREEPPRPYTPIFGTSGSSRLWKWYGRMAHNTYAIRNPTTNVLAASYRVFIGDELTGGREAYPEYTDALVTLAWDIDEPVYVFPSMGGGQSMGEMVHIDVSLDGNTLRAHVDETLPTPELKPLPAGHAFDPAANYAVLNQRSYNAQYGWNVGGYFTLPPGSAIWIEQTGASPGMEIYEGSGRNGAYTPIFGTAGSPKLWKWSGVMVHNTYAVLNPSRDSYWAEYRVFVGDVENGMRDAFSHIDEAVVRLAWGTTPAAFPTKLQIASLACQNGCVTAKFMGFTGRTFSLERSTSLSASAPWEKIAGPIAGTNTWQELMDMNAPADRGFYRVVFEE